MATKSIMAKYFRAVARSDERTIRWVAVALLAGVFAPAVAQVQPSLPPPAQHYQTARAALIAGNMNKADLEMKLALQDNPLDAEAHFLFGCLLERKGEDDQAIVGFQRALSLDPTNPESLYNLGTMLLRREEVVQASGLLEKAVLVRPDHVPTYNNLGKAYFLAGIPELAVAAYEEALRRDPLNVVALKNLVLLAKAGGVHDAADSYRRRLDAIESSHAGKAIIAAEVPLAPNPTWPFATSAAVSPSRTPPQEIAVPETKSAPDSEADALRDLLRDLVHVKIERRGGRLTLLGWTRNQEEEKMLGRILAGWKDVLDLTTDDSGDSQRMIEVDAVIFTQTNLDQITAGFNFLKLVQMNFNYFATDHTRDGTGYSAPGTIGSVTSGFQSGWMFSAAVNYAVNIANASKQQVAVLARPHLTTLSGTPATFLAGGEIVFKVSGNISGDIKPYPYGTSLKVTPTILRALDEDGNPRVHITVEAGRTSALNLLDVTASNSDQVNFEKVSVTSQTVVGLGQTLILSGLSQRESHVGRDGVPGLMYVPVLKYLFSTRSVVQSDVAVMVLLTPRDPAYWDQRNRAALEEFVEKRRAYLQAKQGTPEDMRRFRERYPDWDRIAPNRFAAHFFLVRNSEVYRAVSGQDLASDSLDLELLGKPPKK
jgi:Flp pilus assembly protein TadD